MGLWKKLDELLKAQDVADADRPPPPEEPPEEEPPEEEPPPDDRNPDEEPHKDMVAKPGLSGKEAADNPPRFAKGVPRRVGEKLDDYAARVMRGQLGDNWKELYPEKGAIPPPFVPFTPPLPAVPRPPVLPPRPTPSPSIAPARGLPPRGLLPPVQDPGALRVGPASRPSEAAKGGMSLYDRSGGEWRWFPGDRRHHPHWDYNSHRTPNSQWQNFPHGGAMQHLQ